MNGTEFDFNEAKENCGFLTNFNSLSPIHITSN